MTIKTLYNFGDKIMVDGVEFEILSVHLYESPNKHTERYYLGDGQWLTIKNGGVGEIVKKQIPKQKDNS